MGDTWNFIFTRRGIKAALIREVLPAPEGEYNNTIRSAMIRLTI
jgi:hypothetical protein